MEQVTAINALALKLTKLLSIHELRFLLEILANEEDSDQFHLDLSGFIEEMST